MSSDATYAYYDNKPVLRVDNYYTLKNGLTVRARSVDDQGFIRAYDGKIYALCKDSRGYFFA